MEHRGGRRSCNAASSRPSVLRSSIARTSVLRWRVAPSDTGRSDEHGSAVQQAGAVASGKGISG